jgi:hypothetical protein
VTISYSRRPYSFLCRRLDSARPRAWRQKVNMEAQPSTVGYLVLLIPGLSVVDLFVGQSHDEPLKVGPPFGSPYPQKSPAAIAHHRPPQASGRMGKCLKVSCWLPPRESQVIEKQLDTQHYRVSPHKKLHRKKYFSHADVNRVSRMWGAVIDQESARRTASIRSQLRRGFLAHL